MCIDWTKFWKLLEDVENYYLTGVDQLLKSVNDAYHWDTNWSNDPRNVMSIIGPTNYGLAFAQDSGGNSGTIQKKKPAETKNIKCHTCKEVGHKSYECPNHKAPTTNAVPTSTVSVPNEAAVNHVHIGSNDDISTDDDDDSNLVFSSQWIYNKPQTHGCFLVISQQWMCSLMMLCWKKSMIQIQF